MNSSRRARVLVAGNPNAGKTTIFNALTGSDARVGNYPGVTVDRRSGHFREGEVDIELVDLPGSYSLTARSPEEEVAIGSLLARGDEAPDAVLVVVDSTCVRRGLYFALQVLEVGLPTVIALSLADEARTIGVEPRAEALAVAIGVPVVCVSARTGEGVTALRSSIVRVIESRVVPIDPALAIDARLEAALGRLADGFVDENGCSTRAAHALARYALLSSTPTIESSVILPASRDRAIAERESLERDGIEVDVSIVSARFALVDRFAELVVGSARADRSRTERIDRWLTHPVVGLLVFAVVMAVVFEALFTGSEPFANAIEWLIGSAQGVVTSWLDEGPLRSLLVDGVIAGVGNVVVFVPQIAFLFLFITLLEDSGYLARVAFVIDRLMAGVGLHGKAFVPLLSGFACAIPAVLSTRTIEDRRDRLVTMLALPLMSCSARLPVYALVVATIFPVDHRLFGVFSRGAVVLFGLYVLSVAATLGAAAVLRRTVLRGPRPTLVLELPPYRRPIAKNVLRAVGDRIRSFLTEAGTTILALTIVLWGLLHFPRDPAVESAHARATETVMTTVAEGPAREAALAHVEAETASERMEASALGRVGKALEPVVAPLGFDWRIGVGILGAFAAREVFVSTLGIVFGVGDADETSEPLRGKLRAAVRADGTPLFDVATGASLLVFFVLACQCMSTVAVVRREAGGVGWAIFLVAYMSALAYAGSFLTFVLVRSLAGG